MEQVAIIDYGSGNLHSAAKAFERAAREGEIDCAMSITHDPDAVCRADRIVLPGVGAFADCRAGLDSVPGMAEALIEAVINKDRPFCGICVGMQLMAARGLEHGMTKGFGWIGGDVVAIETDRPGIKIPHMGWNTLAAGVPHELFNGIPLGPEGWHAYFVHSYHFKAVPEVVLATTDYGGVVTAAVGRDNMVGTQFHPEKSQRLGLAFISNFLRWYP